MQECPIHDSGHSGENAPPQDPADNGQGTAYSPRDVPGSRARADSSADGDGSGGARPRSDQVEAAFDDDGAEALAAARLLGGLSALASAASRLRGSLPTPGEKTAKSLRPAKKRKNEEVTAARVFLFS